MGKTFIITANSGIGAETARLLVRSQLGSINIFFTSIREEGCDSLKDQLVSLGARAAYLVGDLTDPSLAGTVVHSCIAEFGRIDGLFNVAGGSGRLYGDGPAHLCTDSGWDRTLELNLTTQFRLCREVLSVMLKQDPVDGIRGSLLNMSSILGVHPEPINFNSVAYAASKAAIIGLTNFIAAAYAHDSIRANAVAPALVQTAMSARASEDPAIVAAMKQKQPLAGGMIPVEQVAEVCRMLLAGPYSITGQCVEIDAGWRLM